MTNIWQRLFGGKKKTVAAGNENLIAYARTAMKKSDETILAIFNDHCLSLLDKNADYIIFSVCGADANGSLTSEQAAIFSRVNPAVMNIYNKLKLEAMSAEQQETILFIIRFLTALKILYMMEMFRNLKKDKEAMQKNVRKRLEEMDACGHA